MQKAFSLVELSIVIVIIGLLVGGILAGQSLIRSAELRSAVTEVTEYKAAIVSFRIQYDETPGDMPDAELIWGAPASCPDAAGTGTQTCNGDGDGRVTLSGPADEFSEAYSFWQHLANAGLINGKYSGRAGPDRLDHTIGDINVPISGADSTAIWHAQTYQNLGSSLAFNFRKEENILRLGGETPNWNNGAIFTIDEAWSIDKKIDDGHATQGQVWAVRWNQCTPAISNVDYQDYDFGVTGKQCGLAFLGAF